MEYFATSEKLTTGFSEQQISEEKLKAELILGHTGCPCGTRVGPTDAARAPKLHSQQGFYAANFSSCAAAFDFNSGISMV